jgi:sugar diacid utilization regulator
MFPHMTIRIFIMAKAQTKKTKTTKTTKTQKTSAVRKGALAYLGLYGVAYERAVMRAEQVKGLYATKVKGSTDGLFTELVARGEKVEELALGTAKTAQKRAVETFETTTDKVKAALPTSLPFGANDRVEELEAEVAALNKKIVALSKKSAAKKSAAKTGINKSVMNTKKTPKKAA